MTGILERIEAKLDMLLSAKPAPVAVIQALQPAVVQPAPVAADPFGLAAPAAAVVAAAPVNVTSEQLMALVEPHLANDAVKTAMREAMVAAGVNSFPEIQPTQYGHFYALFTNVLARFGIGGAVAAAAPAAATPLI